MAEYYLISQLPSLDALNENAPLPITEERLLELCSQLLGKKALKEIENLTLVPPANSVESEKSGSPLVCAWNDHERNLRLALGMARAGKMNKPFDLQNKNLPGEICKAANTAVETENPLEAEKFLLNYRLSFLETLRPADTFATEYIFYYLIKLRLISRIRQFDTNLGKAAYTNIYNSILNRNDSEAK